MSERQLRCGNCGADVTFTSPGALVAVCGHCGWASRRTDVDLKTIGKVSQVAVLASHFQLGTRGTFRGRGFTVRGQVQLDHGAGVWNEWAAEDDHGDWLWIAEAQGQLLVQREDSAPVGLRAENLTLGAALRLDRIEYRVTEVGRGRIVTLKGELPRRVDPGAPTLYADLQSGERDVATVEWSQDGRATVFAGRWVDLDDLQVDPSTQPRHTPPRVKSKRLDCRMCGAGIELFDPEQTRRVGCESCGALLAPDGDVLRVVEAEKKGRAKSALPLGAEATLLGTRYRVLGCMERRVRSHGRWWPWREYALRTREGAYHWLVESDGHWLLGRPIQWTAVDQGGIGVAFERQRFKHFTSGKAEVHWVVGEFHWRVARDDAARTKDYVHGTRMVSLELDDDERHATLGEHLPRKAVAAAFPGVRLPRRKGVGAAQPNPHQAGLVWGVFGLLAIAALLVRVLTTVGHENRVVLRESFGPTPRSNGQEQVDFTEPFELTADPGNANVQLWVPGLEQGWVGLNGALVNMESGEVVTFAASAQHYSGTSGGERWTEGNRIGEAWVGSIDAGTYRLRLASSGWDKGLGVPYQVTVRSQVPRAKYLVVVVLLLLAFPIVNTVISVLFERARWESSDHPWGEQS
ncbi:MAG: DUF4178 domain-containing protein [Planctomycetota bacterium]